MSRMFQFKRFWRACRPLGWALFLLTVLASSCSSVDTANTSVRPWNGPTRSDQSQGWWFRDDYEDSSRGLYP